MVEMFSDSKFDSDISNWKINNDCATSKMFADCVIRREYKPKKRNKKIS
jgi:hypothetical protein